MKYFKVFSNVFFVRGFNRATICDLQRNQFITISHELCNFAIGINDKSEKFVERLLRENESYNEYLEFLLTNEYIFICDSKLELKYFPKLSLSYYFPSIITNAVIENASFKSIARTVELLEGLNVAFIQLKFTKVIQKNNLIELLTFFYASSFKSVEIILPDVYNDIEINFISENLRRPFLFVFYNSISMKERNGYLKNMSIIRTEKDIAQINYGRINDESYFRCNITLFSEAQKFNTYFNKKIYFTENGEIKNAFESNTLYGSIYNTSVKDLQRIITSKGFQKLWYVNKDKTDVCKDCEFRYLCVDNRMLYKRKNSVMHYHKEECNYNPYISRWKSQPNYFNLKKCGITSNSVKFRLNNKMLVDVTKNF